MNRKVAEPDFNVGILNASEFQMLKKSGRTFFPAEALVEWTVFQGYRIWLKASPDTVRLSGGKISSLGFRPQSYRGPGREPSYWREITEGFILRTLASHPGMSNRQIAKLIFEGKRGLHERNITLRTVENFVSKVKKRREMKQR